MSSTIDSDDKTLARDAFAAFLRDACLHADDSHWYSVRGTYSDHSLSLLTFLDLREYATMLYVAGLLNVRGTKAITSDTAWNAFPKDKLLGDGGATGAAEATKTKVDVNKMIETRLRPRGENRMETYFLRVGHYKLDGETTTASAQLLADIPAPMLSRDLRNSQRKLALALAPVLEKYRSSQSVSCVNEWVKWTAIDEYGIVLSEHPRDESDCESDTDEQEAPLQQVTNNVVVNDTNTLISTASTHKTTKYLSKART
jgi:hypothetical protein